MLGFPSEESRLESQQNTWGAGADNCKHVAKNSSLKGEGFGAKKVASKWWITEGGKKQTLVEELGIAKANLVQCRMDKLDACTLPS